MPDLISISRDEDEDYEARARGGLRIKSGSLRTGSLEPEVLLRLAAVSYGLFYWVSYRACKKQLSVALIANCDEERMINHHVEWRGLDPGCE